MMCQKFKLGSDKNGLTVLLSTNIRGQLLPNKAVYDSNSLIESYDDNFKITIMLRRFIGIAVSFEEDEPQQYYIFTRR